MRPARLATFLEDRLREREQTADEFAKKNKINSSGFYRFLKGQTLSLSDRNLGKVAIGLGMPKGELLLLAEGGGEADEVQAEVQARVPAFADELRRMPREHWSLVLDLALHNMREVAQLLAKAGVKEVKELTVQQRMARLASDLDELRAEMAELNGEQ